MTGYMIVQTAISDTERFGEYREAVMPLIARFGGKLVVRGGVEVLEGAHDGRTLVIFEFPSVDAVRAFWDSPDYGPVKTIRDGAATMDVWAAPAI